MSGVKRDWARAEIQRIYDRYEMSMSGTAFRELADALSQAYERGQESMRERAAVAASKFPPLVSEGESIRHAHQGDIATAIRSLPIEQDSEVKG